MAELIGYEFTPSPTPIFHNEFETKPQREKKSVKIGDKITFAGRHGSVGKIYEWGEVDFHYADNTGFIHTLRVPEVAL